VGIDDSHLGLPIKLQDLNNSKKVLMSNHDVSDQKGSLSEKMDEDASNPDEANLPSDQIGIRRVLDEELIDVAEIQHREELNLNS
jgi:hypothetical protein